MASAEIAAPYVLGAGPLKKAADILFHHWERLSSAARISRFHGGVGEAWLRRRANECAPDVVLGIEADGNTRAIVELYDVGNGAAEVALSVEDAYQGRGYGRELFASALEHARAKGINTVEATFSHSNRAMLQIAKNAGADITSDSDERWSRIEI